MRTGQHLVPFSSLGNVILVRDRSQSAFRLTSARRDGPVRRILESLFATGIGLILLVVSGCCPEPDPGAVCYLPEMVQLTAPTLPTGCPGGEQACLVCESLQTDGFVRFSDDRESFEWVFVSDTVGEVRVTGRTFVGGRPFPDPEDLCFASSGMTP